MQKQAQIRATPATHPISTVSTATPKKNASPSKSHVHHPASRRGKKKDCAMTVASPLNWESTALMPSPVARSSRSLRAHTPPQHNRHEQRAPTTSILPPQQHRQQCDKKMQDQLPNPRCTACPYHLRPSCFSRYSCHISLLPLREHNSSHDNLSDITLHGHRSSVACNSPSLPVVVSSNFLLTSRQHSLSQ